MKKVRYMTVPLIAVELASKLSVNEKANFVDFLYYAFKQIEKGEQVISPNNDGVMSIAYDYTITELETGYKNYYQKMTAVEKSKEKKRSKELREMGIDPAEIVDTTPISRRTIADTSPMNMRLNQSDRLKGIKGSTTLTESSIRSTAFPEMKQTVSPAHTKALIDGLTNWGLDKQLIEKAIDEHGFTLVYDIAIKWNQDRQNNRNITVKDFTTYLENATQKI